MKKRIAKILFDKPKERYEFAVQYYDENSGWEFVEYCDTMIVMDEEVECQPHPKLFNTYDEAKSKINMYDEQVDDITLNEFYYEI